MTKAAVMTYGEDFEADIRGILRDRFARERLFQWWLGEVTFACDRCKADFTPSESVDQDDEVLCAKCQRKGRS